MKTQQKIRTSPEQERKKARIRSKLETEIGYMRRSNVKRMEIQLKKMTDISYLDYEDAIARNLDLMTNGVNFAWNERKEGVVIITLQ